MKEKKEYKCGKTFYTVYLTIKGKNFTLDAVFIIPSLTIDDIPIDVLDQLNQEWSGSNSE